MDSQTTGHVPAVVVLRSTFLICRASGRATGSHPGSNPRQAFAWTRSRVRFDKVESDSSLSFVCARSQPKTGTRFSGSRTQVSGRAARRDGKRSRGLRRGEPQAAFERCLNVHVEAAGSSDLFAEHDLFRKPVSV